MASGFVPYDRSQLLLLPVSVDEWVPEDHPVRFVTDGVELLDLSEFEARYRLGGAGRRAYHPAMMVGLLLWAYANGVFSSREIERRCETDLAFRFVAANQVPDHATVARFRVVHREALKRLHAQVLLQCAEMGLVSLGLVALDGTKMKGNASKDANRSREWLEEQIEELLRQADSTDAAEDDEHGSARGDEVPDGLRGREARLRNMRAAKERIEERERDRKRPRRKPKAGTERRDSGPVGNVTDPDSSLMPVRGGGFVQGYNAQAVANPAGVVLFSKVVTTAPDVSWFVPVLGELRELLTELGIWVPYGTVVADAGYWSAANATADVGAREVLIATDSSEAKIAAEGVKELPVAPEERTDTFGELAKRRASVLDRWDAGNIDGRGAAAELGVSPQRLYELRAAYRSEGIDGLRLRKAPNGNPRPRQPKRPSWTQQVKQTMRQKLMTDDGKATYRQRAPTIEGVFGRDRHNLKFTHFSQRGLDAVDAEWSFLHTAQNLMKIRTALERLGAVMAGYPLREAK